MSQHGSIGRSKTLAAAVLAFAASAGLGRSLALRPPDAESQSAEASPAEIARGSSVVYKIPVSISQARLGSPESLVTLVQWCDFPDPGCKRMEPALQRVLDRHKAEVSLVFRHYMSDSRRDSARAHQFARAAHEQAGKFWEVRALLLAHEGELSDAALERYAGQVGLDWPAALKAVDGGVYSGHVAADRIFAGMFDVKQTPALFANGRPLIGEPTETFIEKLVSEELARAKKLVSTGVKRTDLYAELIKNGVWTPPTRSARTP